MSLSRAALSSLHITNAWHPTSGGVRTFYRALIAQGNREGRRVTVVVPAERPSTEPVGAFGRIHFVAAPAAPGFDRRYRLLYPHTYLPPLGGPLHRILASECPDVVEICDKYTLPYLAAVVRKGLLRGVRRPALVGLTAERFDDNMDAYLSQRAGAAPDGRPMLMARRQARPWWRRSRPEAWRCTRNGMVRWTRLGSAQACEAQRPPKVSPPPRTTSAPPAPPPPAHQPATMAASRP